MKTATRLPARLRFSLARPLRESVTLRTGAIHRTVNAPIFLTDITSVPIGHLCWIYFRTSSIDNTITTILTEVKKFFIEGQDLK